MEEGNSIYNDPQRLLAAMTAENPNLSTPDLLDAQTVKRGAAEHVRKIFEHWSLLKHILERYEPILRKRWGKKSGEQRKKMLLSAWPNMPTAHRPDFQALQRESTAQRRGGTKVRDEFLFPYLNLEDLLKTKPLLLLLNSRAYNAPCVSAPTELKTAHLSPVSQAVVPGYLSGYTMLLAGQTTKDTYGRLLSWDEDDSAFGLMHYEIQFQPGEGCWF